MLERAIVRLAQSRHVRLDLFIIGRRRWRRRRLNFAIQCFETRGCLRSRQTMSGGGGFPTAASRAEAAEIAQKSRADVELNSTPALSEESDDHTSREAVRRGGRRI